MIGKKLQELLDLKGSNVHELSRLTGVSAQTLYSIIKRNNMKIDFEVLLKICNVLSVSVESFYSDYVDSTNVSIAKQPLTPHQTKVINAYIDQPEMQPAIDKILGIEPESALTANETTAS